MYDNKYFFSHPSKLYEALLAENNTPFQVLEKLDSFVESFFKDKDSKTIIGEGTDIGENAVIGDYVIIGKNCTIMPHALIRPYTIIGDGCVIGHAAEIKHSLIMDGAKVQSFAFAGDSIIGKSARVGSGTIIANRGFDQETITVKIDGEAVSCGSDFFGAVIGDYARIGANSTTQPGTLIGPYSWVFPATNIWGFIPSETKVMNNKSMIFEPHEKVVLTD